MTEKALTKPSSAFGEVEDNLLSSAELVRRSFSLLIAFFHNVLKLFESASAPLDAPEVSTTSADCCIFNRCTNKMPFTRRQTTFLLPGLYWFFHRLANTVLSLRIILGFRHGSIITAHWWFLPVTFLDTKRVWFLKAFNVPPKLFCKRGAFQSNQNWRIRVNGVGFQA